MTKRSWFLYKGNYNSFTIKLSSGNLMMNLESSYFANAINVSPFMKCDNGMKQTWRIYTCKSKHAASKKQSRIHPAYLQQPIHCVRYFVDTEC